MDEWRGNIQTKKTRLASVSLPKPLPYDFPKSPADKAPCNKGHPGFIGKLESSVSSKKIFHGNNECCHGAEGNAGPEDHDAVQALLMIGLIHEIKFPAAG
jgi:hypothetical protein